MTTITEFVKAGLSRKLAVNLTGQGVDTMGKLFSLDIEELQALQGVGDKAILQIMKLKEDVNSQAEPDPAPGPAKTETPDPGPPVEKYMTEEPPKELATVTTKTYNIELQFRHAEWITRASEAYGISEEQVIQQAIRAAYAKDPYKAGLTAVSGSVLKHDNPHSKS